MKAKQQEQKNSNRVAAVLYSLGIGLSVIGVICFILGTCFESMEVIYLGLALVSVGLGFVALYLSKTSDNRMKAMARLEFREKIAMMYGYMGDEDKRRKCDIEAAEELQGWVGSDLQKEYDEVKKEHDEFVKGDIVTPVKESFESDIDMIKKDLGEIRELLKEIKQGQSEDRKVNEQQLLIGWGLTCVVVGSTLIITAGKLNGGFVLIVIGIFIVVTAYSSKYFRKK